MPGMSALTKVTAVLGRIDQARNEGVDVTRVEKASEQ
jgi:hypothetical protein